MYYMLISRYIPPDKYAHVMNLLVIHFDVNPIPTYLLIIPNLPKEKMLPADLHQLHKAVVKNLERNYINPPDIAAIGISFGGRWIAYKGIILCPLNHK